MKLNKNQKIQAGDGKELIVKNFLMKKGIDNA